VHTPSLEQLALARFIKEGKLERHVTRMKRVYASRRRFIKEALIHYFPGEHTIAGDSTGLHLIAEFPKIEFSDEVAWMLRQNGIGSVNSNTAGIPIFITSIINRNYCAPGDLRYWMASAR
jgi:DNA-binding transcriptional MocR family regulator